MSFPFFSPVAVAQCASRSSNVCYTARRTVCIVHHLFLFAFFRVKFTPSGHASVRATRAAAHFDAMHQSLDLSSEKPPRAQRAPWES
eukprot:2868406-Amphidinium_carterae.1